MITKLLHTLLITSSFILVFFKANAIEFKIIDKNTLQPIQSAILYYNDRAVAISDSLGYIKLERVRASKNDYPILVFSINYKVAKSKTGDYKDDIINIIELQKFENKANDNIEKEKFNKLVLYSIEKNIKILKKNSSYVAEYYQTELQILDNRIKKNYDIDKSILVVCDKNAKLTKLEMFDQQVEEGFKDVFDKFPCKSRSFNVIKKIKKYNYSVDNIYYNSDFNSDIIEVSAVNIDNKKFTEKYVFKIRLSDTSLVYMSSLFIPNSNNIINMYNPHTEIIYEIFEKNVIYPIFVSSTFKQETFLKKEKCSYLKNRNVKMFLSY